MHEESGRLPLRGGCHPIERNELGGRRSAERRAAAPLRPTTGVRIELLDGFACTRKEQPSILHRARSGCSHS